jgi:hypothetical protein
MGERSNTHHHPAPRHYEPSEAIQSRRTANAKTHHSPKARLVSMDSAKDVLFLKKKNQKDFWSWGCWHLRAD